MEAQLGRWGVPFTRLSVAPGQADATSWIRQVQARQSEHLVPDILLLLMGYPEPLRSVVGEAHSRNLVPPACFLGDPAGRAVFPDWWEIAGTDATQVPFLSCTRPARPTGKGKRISMDFKTQYGREPTFVALEGYDSVLALARAFEGAGTTEPSNVCDAMRRMEFEGTRGTIKFSTEREGAVHQQWKWPPVCVVAFSHARQAFSETDLLWDAEHRQSFGAKSLHRAG
ncbi:MAG: ABC transporter substrate-binding protein [Burkholderiales bacterium]